MTNICHNFNKIKCNTENNEDYAKCSLTSHSKKYSKMH